jgi:hypothetical protein
MGETVRRVAALPGVEVAAMTTDLPVAHLSWRRPVNIEDLPDESRKGLFSEITSVTPDYFEVLQASPCVASVKTRTRRKVRASEAKRATRSERADEAASESACGGV